jgi:hypothetical protein
MATPKGNPIKGSECDPKGKTVGLGVGAGRAPVAPGKAFPGAARSRGKKAKR